MNLTRQNFANGRRLTIILLFTLTAFAASGCRRAPLQKAKSLADNILDWRYKPKPVPAPRPMPPEPRPNPTPPEVPRDIPDFNIPDFDIPDFDIESYCRKAENWETLLCSNRAKPKYPQPKPKPLVIGDSQWIVDFCRSARSVQFPTLCKPTWTTNSPRVNKITPTTPMNRTAKKPNPRHPATADWGWFARFCKDPTNWAICYRPVIKQVQ
jgi:hypothetical protein